MSITTSYQHSIRGFLRHSLNSPQNPDSAINFGVTQNIGNLLSRGSVLVSKRQTYVAKHMRVMLHNVKGSRRRRGFTTKADSIWSFQGTNTIGYETAV